MTTGKKLADSEQARLIRQAAKLRANLQKRKQQKRARQVVEGDVAADEAGVSDVDLETLPDSPSTDNSA